MLDDVHPLGHAAENGVLVIQARLRHDAHEELCSIAVGLRRDPDRRNGSAIVLHIADLALQQVESSSPPEILRRLGILEQRVAPLNNSIQKDAKKCAAVVI